MTAFPSPTLLLKKIGHGVIIWYFKIMRISVRNFFYSKVLCPRGGLTLKTQQVLNHELMSAMKEYLTQGRKNFWRTIEKTMRWNGKYEERSSGSKAVWYCSCPHMMGWYWLVWRRLTTMNELPYLLFHWHPILASLKNLPPPFLPPFSIFFLCHQIFSVFLQTRSGRGGVCVCVLFKEFLLGMRGTLHRRFSIFSHDSNVVLWWQVFLKCKPNQIFWMIAW